MPPPPALPDPVAVQLVKMHPVMVAVELTIYTPPPNVAALQDVKLEESTTSGPLEYNPPP